MLIYKVGGRLELSINFDDSDSGGGNYGLISAKSLISFILSLGSCLA
jgi:hypothetical protein